MKGRTSRGFTLVEMMMAIVISVAVFAAMGTLLNRCFSLWLDAQAQWKLAQHARVTRLQILNGGFGVGTGLLSSTNVSVRMNGSWKLVEFQPVTKGGAYFMLGWPGDSMQNIWLFGGDGEGSAVAQTVSRWGYSEQPSVLVNHFDATVSNQIVTLSYTLNFLSMGRTNTLPQVIEARLVNE